MIHFKAAEKALIWQGGGETVQIDAWGTDSLRVRARASGPILDLEYALLEAEPSQPKVELEDTESRITNGTIVGIISDESGWDDAAGHYVSRCRVRIEDKEGKTLLEELSQGGSLKYEPREFIPIVGGDHSVKQSFTAQDGEKLYGMGMYQQDQFDLKGSTLELAHRNSQASVPFLVSSLGYGFLWNSPAIGEATFATNRTSWTGESARQIDYWVTAADTPKAISRNYANATGAAPMMPEYGLGYWQCKLRYWNQEQLLEVAREHKRREIPLDVIVADFFHWPKMGDFRFDEEFWPDPKAMVDELKDMGVELMVSVWPQVALDSENFPLLDTTNALVRADRGVDIHMGFQGPSAFLDPTSPGGRKEVWELIKKNYYDLGIRVFWLDEAEPEYSTYDFDNYRYYKGPSAQVSNIYPLEYARLFYDGQTDSGQKDVANLLRCAWAGSQRYGAIVWSGDISSTWDDLRNQIPVGLHMGLAGIPWFTTDIGGFHEGDITDTDFHELLVRWFQFGAFCPVMRMHGDRLPYEEITASDGSSRLRSGASNEVWTYGEDVGEILESYIRLRERLRPYTRETMKEAHESGTPVMRALFYEFPEDPKTWDVGDQYLFGENLLVAPVLEPGANSRTVYLPAGEMWTEVATGETYEGGTTVEATADLKTIPVFARGTEVPEALSSLGS